MDSLKPTPTPMPPMPDLSTPTALREVDITSLCLAIVSSFSVIGAGFMMTSFVCLPNLRSYRHSLIFGLAVADFVRALNSLISASMVLAHRNLDAPSLKVFCAINGFANEVFVVQQDYWVLLIAVFTFILLTDNPRTAAWIQRRQIVLFSLPWLLSIIWAWIGLQVSGGYESTGSLCWFGEDKARLFINFIPRWIIILTILNLYLRIYVLLSRSASIAARQPVNPRTSGSSFKPAHGFLRGRSRCTRGDAKLKKTARGMMQYPIAYALIWVTPTGARIYHAATGKTVPSALHTADLCCVVISGFINAITYGVNEPALTSWRAFFSRRPYHPPDAASRPNSFLLRPRASAWSSRPAANPNRLTIDSQTNSRPRPMSEHGRTVQMPGPEPAHPKLPSAARFSVRIPRTTHLPEEHADEHARS